MTINFAMLYLELWWKPQKAFTKKETVYPECIMNVSKAYVFLKDIMWNAKRKLALLIHDTIK